MIEIYTGIDIVDNERFKKAINKYQDKFLKKLFFCSEIDYCKEKMYKYECLASRFAVKEAVIKAFYSAFSIKLFFKEIEVKGKKGRPAEILLHLPEGKKKSVSKPYKISISLSHEKNFSVAVAVIYIY